jgi:hypothetical protein
MPPTTVPCTLLNASVRCADVAPDLKSTSTMSRMNRPAYRAGFVTMLLDDSLSGGPSGGVTLTSLRESGLGIEGWVRVL